MASIFRVSVFLACLFVYPLQSFAQTKSDKVRTTKVNWTFDYHNFPAKIRIYQLKKSASFEISDTKTLPLSSGLPFGKEITSPYELGVHKLVNLALVIENRDRIKPLFFYANFHNMIPPENSVGQKISCLCNNHIYKVKPNSLWYRVVQVFIYPYYQGESINVKHDIYGLSEDEIKARNLMDDVDAPG